MNPPGQKIFKTLAILSLALTGLLSLALPGLEIETDNASMQSDRANNDPTFARFRKAFNSDYELVLTITRPGAATAKNRELLEEDLQWIRSVPGVGSALAPAEEEGDTAAILIALAPQTPRKTRMAALDTLRSGTGGHIEGQVHLVGLPAIRQSIERRIHRDQQTVIPLSLGGMVLILAALFRRPAGVILPMAVVGASLVSTLGLYATFGFQLNSITSLLPPVVIVLSVSVAIHLFEGWLLMLRSNQYGEDAIRKTISLVWKPCVFTAAMTAAGLLSLTISPIPAVRQFGLFSAIGVSFSVLFAFGLIPAGLAWTREIHASEKQTGIDRFVQKLANAPGQRPKTILLAALLLSLASLALVPRIQNSTDLIRFFKKHDPVRIAHDRVEEQLGSVRSIDLLLQRTDGGAFDPFDDAEPLTDFTQALEKIPDIVRIDSLTKAFKDGVIELDPEPNPLMDRLVADKGKLLRLQIHLGDVGSARTAKICDRIQDEASAILGNRWKVEPSGAYYEMVRDSNQLVATLLKSFTFSLAVILISTGLLFRSFSVMVAAFIPNILPILWGAGIMGALRIDLSAGTAMIAAVLIGLAVDDTIHYLHHLQHFRHRPIREATRSATLRIGHALTASTIVLVGGFWMGAFGSFIPTNTFSLLIGCMMVFALFCDLLVLPAYLNLAQRNPVHANL